MAASEIVYRSGPTYRSPTPEWTEEGTLPACVDALQTGDFTCNCGHHQVKTHLSNDPLDNTPRMARVVWIQSPWP